jgi:hypothetical protein
VLYSSQYHLRTGTCDLNHPVLAGAENTDNALLIIVIVGELCQWKMSIPLCVIIQDTCVKHIFNNLIDLLGMTISLRMISEASDKMGTKALMYLFPETCNKNRSSTRDDGIWNVMIVDDVCNVQRCILPDSISGANRYEVG